MHRAIFCLLVLSGTAPLSTGCGNKPSGEMQWPAEGDPKEMIDIIKSTKSPGDLDPRIIAAKRLGAMGPRAQEALPHLQKLTKDKNPDLANAAKEAIAKIKGQ